ncbi:quorum-sensing autoinducer 1 sensor kinase/phosphatase LuxN [Vibrio lentus]|uniref:Autoinducer 1 sensor kinase/phosphatase LuxN n=1 Tax=Vibrio lentus TaxID=136468 RepID=A0AA44VTV8_9VIBR|nr:hybrid sensor histidine kinase/response regulator [Vibrio lentus]MCB5360423.1 hybrid sensor histidine kinase/response regulator [Vibrio lentus]MCB5450751.1 hybrid sensor histidine kinase/response regulator [Vibrio lentus]MCB5463740.1 hybrid sensor histidine kinase/response regulator [Vibrio lentus]MCC4791602.1 hybrid sensor histidine kinase/response regulator [Vibrio lentus]MCC4851333.1 hybrid sensor histidine kinase/response regulator [Vibrio lentus]
MFDFGLEAIVYAKAITLLATVAVVVMWLLYYCYRLKLKNEAIAGTHHVAYIAYSVCIVAWISSNAYFHTDLLPQLGASTAVLAAKFANLASFFAFAFAYYFSCQLAAEQRNGKVHVWQQAIFVTLTVYSFFINLSPGLTVEDVTIVGPSQFVIEFGPHTSYFFIGMISFVVLTLVNLVAMRANSSKLTLTKTSYMIAGILVFMLSTATIHLGMTFFLRDFSLTWLPPALSISEMLFVGYALLTSRFYSVKYLAYMSLNALLVCAILVIPFGAIFIPLTDDNQWLIAIPICALIGVTWHVLYKRLGRYASFFVYGNKETPVQQILALEEDFKLSIDDAMRRLGSLLQIPEDKLRLVNSNYNETFYEDYLSTNKSVLVFDELSEELDYTAPAKSSIKALYEKMSSNNTALVMPLFGQGKSVTHLLVSSHKSNDQMFSNEEISALQTLLTRVQSTIEADRRIRQSRALANSIAHEMRNPLAQVQLHFEILKQHIDNQAPAKQILLDIENGQAAIQRGRQLIDIILREVSDSSPEHGPITMTSIHKAVDQAVSHYGFENEKIIERIRLPQHADFVAKLNETLFNFVIFNLIRNAIYYFDSYPDSQIEISTTTGSYENILVFRDTGPGIDETIAHKIFDDFFSYQKSGGSGLGLGYCQRVMRSFGGRVECKSKLGEFTEFHLYFPVVPNAPKADALRTPYFNDWKHNQPAENKAETEVKPEKQAPSADNVPEPATETEKTQATNPSVSNHLAPTVLIVDDKEVQRTLVQMYLNRLGVNSLQANNGENAVDLFKTHQVDLILMDVQMPVMNGFDASQIIKARSPNTPIIALSGESGQRELDMISKLMDGRLEKPTSLNALQDVLDNWLKKGTTSNASKEAEGEE